MTYFPSPRWGRELEALTPTLRNASNRPVGPRCADNPPARAAISTSELAISSEVQELLVEVPTPHLDVLPNGTPLSNRFSVPYAVAAALIFGHARPNAFDPDHRVMELAARAVVRAADLPRSNKHSDPARVTVKKFSRACESHQVDLRLGAYPYQGRHDKLKEKFCTLSWADDPAGLYARLMHVADLDDVASLLANVSGA